MNRPQALTKIQKNCAMLRLFVPITGLFFIAIAALAGCRSPAATDVVDIPPEESTELLCGEQGYVSTELYGALRMTLDWRESDLECSGMPRPEGRGARLRFAGHGGGDDTRLAFIIAIPEFSRDTTSGEFSSNVTLIEEGNGRFFSTSDLNNCLTHIVSATSLDDSGDRYAIVGELYCISPLAEINGQSSISITEMRFSGLLDWGAS
jgi:hypothetical protein